ncbi:MAG TPA: hypothetical protein VK077_01490 [Virgibacillus sp.]|nr:hypothetical protein [Virgibacillus sp.]
MNIQVTSEAAKWYISELDLQPSSYLRFFPRYGGVGGLIPGFSIGISFDKPVHLHASTQVEGITFFIEQNDAWYFDEKNELKIALNKTLNEPEFIYS